mgnify:CR=1 FL=1
MKMASRSTAIFWNTRIWCWDSPRLRVRSTACFKTGEGDVRFLVELLGNAPGEIVQFYAVELRRPQLFRQEAKEICPGGVVAFVTSRYTMDSKDSTVRKYLAERADLLGAIRLPNNAFKANAGTEVVSDIIFLQKRDRPAIEQPGWVQVDRRGH